MVTNSDDDMRLYRLWRSHGWEPKKDYRFWFTTWGLNIRPTELQGAFGGVQMTRLEGFRLARARNARYLIDRILDRHQDFLYGMTIVPQCDPSWHGFPIFIDVEAPFSRDELCRYLDASGVETRPVVAGNLAKQPAIMADERIICGPLPGADLVHEQGFYIGIASFDDEAGISFVSDTIDQFIRDMAP